jgi:hypothetical protein
MDTKLVNSNTFTIELKVPSGEEFSGKFTVHRPTIGERIRIGVIEAQELAGLSNIDTVVSQLAHLLATFDIVIDSAPPWWKPRELREMEVLYAVYQKYIDFVQTFQSKPQPETTG